jgi:hypothetical protein
MRTGAIMTSMMIIVGVAVGVAGPVNAETARVKAVSATQADNNTQARVGGAQAATTLAPADISRTSTTTVSEETGSGAATNGKPRVGNTIR